MIDKKQFLEWAKYIAQVPAHLYPLISTRADRIEGIRALDPAAARILDKLSANWTQHKAIIDELRAHLKARLGQ